MVKFKRAKRIVGKKAGNTEDNAPGKKKKGVLQRCGEKGRPAPRTGILT